MKKTLLRRLEFAEIVLIIMIMLGYKEYGDHDSKTLVVLLAPGIECGEYWEKTMSVLCQDYRYLCIDYPGRGDSKDYIVSNPEVIGALIADVVNSKPFEEVILVGYSIGSVFALKAYNWLESEKISRIILIAGGEYLFGFRTLLKILFFPAKFSEHVRRLYRKILLSSSIFDFFPEENLKIINEMWLEMLNWRIPNMKISATPLELIVMKKDKVVHKPSIQKLLHYFPDHQVHTYPFGHFTSENEIKDIMRNSFLGIKQAKP